jgi:hypothetical protein
VVERQLPKLYVVGSIPIARSKISGSYFSDLAKFGTVAPSIFMPHMLQICRKHYQPLTGVPAAPCNMIATCGVLVRESRMTNLLARAINCSDGDQAAKIIQDAVGIESDDAANYCFLQTWPAIASSTPALLANGCIPRHVSWPHQGMRGNWMAACRAEFKRS